MPNEDSISVLTYFIENYRYKYKRGVEIRVLGLCPQTLQYK